MFNVVELLQNVWFLILACPLSFAGVYCLFHHYTKPLYKEVVVEDNTLDKWVLIDLDTIHNNSVEEGYWEEVQVGNNMIMKHHKAITWLAPDEVINWEVLN